MAMLAERNLSHLLSHHEYPMGSKRLIKDAVEHRFYAMIEQEIVEKSSLLLYRNLNRYEQGAYYIEEAPDSVRHTILNFRIGNWKWQINKNRGEVNRLCVLCNELETLEHFFIDCNGLNLLRLQHNFQLEQNSEVYALLDSRDMEVLHRLSKFLESLVQIIVKK